MKLISCQECQDLVGLTRAWRNCECLASGGGYERDGDKVVIAGPCLLIAMQNGIRDATITRGEAWIYDESNGKVTRLTENRGGWPDGRGTPRVKMMEAE